MRAYFGIKFHSDNRNRVTIESISQVLDDCGFDTVCVVRDLEMWGDVQMTPAELMAETFSLIRSCQVMVIDLTEKGVGLGIEAGYAYAQRIPIITIAQETSNISTTLQGISSDVYLYSVLEDLRSFFSNLDISRYSTERG